MVKNDNLPLIEKIEIKYFRSIHDVTLNRCERINIITGGNDSGKSNVLRALNLFFSNQTDFDIPYDFEKDLAIRRVAETQASRKQAFIYVKITFNNIFQFQSLPKQFAVKKQWNRYWDEPDTSYFPRNLKSANVSKFLNRIQLHYVPAIKDREIFQHYLKLVHNTLVSSNVQLRTASRQFSDVISAATQSMEERIKSGIGVESRIDFPDDLSILFGDLDFSTMISDNVWLSFKQRGDGIQIGHIPYILDFLARQNTDKAFVWVYEEPENSLEMTRAFELADKFLNDFSKKNQIFLTTHSPAFYALEGPHAKKWFVDQTREAVEEKHYYSSRVTPSDSIDDVDNLLGVAALIKKHAKKIFDEREILLKQAKRLTQLEKSTLVCEGSTDVKYIQKAIEILDPELAIHITVQEVGANNKNTGSDSLKKLRTLLINNDNITSGRCIFVFDCDETSLPHQETGKISTFRFNRLDGRPLKNGIENNFPNETLDCIYSDEERFWSLRSKTGSGGAVISQVRELKKTEVCEFICNRALEEDFQPFHPLVSFIRENVILNE
ncbi:ATP-dependent nuclease [Kordiimonas sp.]|uniref:ATP-dependent nuclease n=1 Tax=Kordiimonas sp. TaxID=1970157 RepID=UPI003A8F4660